MNEIDTDTESVVEQVRCLLLRLAMGLTTHHDSLNLSVSRSHNDWTLAFRAHAQDTPKLIGHNGITAKAFKVVTERISDATGLNMRMGWVLEPLHSEEVDGFHYHGNSNINDECQLLGDLVGFIEGTAIRVDNQNDGHQASRLIVSREDGLPLADDPELEEALNVIYGAIGKQCGRRLCVVMEAGA